MTILVPNDCKLLMRAAYSALRVSRSFEDLYVLIYYIRYSCDLTIFFLAWVNLLLAALHLLVEFCKSLCIFLLLSFSFDAATLWSACVRLVTFALNVRPAISSLLSAKSVRRAFTNCCKAEEIWHLCFMLDSLTWTTICHFFGSRCLSRISHEKPWRSMHSLTFGPDAPCLIGHYFYPVMSRVNAGE